MNALQNSLKTIKHKKLFIGICFALLPTGFSFVMVSNIIYQLKTEFILTNTYVGYIGGSALWGMAISLLIFGPFLERFGLKAAVIGAFVSHLIGVTLFLAAYPFEGKTFAFWILFLGAIGFGIGNGLIEVAGNPLIATLFPENKAIKLNHFHAFYPGGLVIGGLIGWLMSQIGDIGVINIGHWTLQITIVYIPVIIYGIILLPEKFPKTETAEAGIPTREMFRYTFTHPLIWGLVFMEMILLSLEIGPSRWIPDVLEAAGVPGILVFVWISGLMMVLRRSAKPFVRKLSPPGMLLYATFLVGSGLIMLSFFNHGLLPVMIAATVFAVGVAFCFPTMVGLMSERFPKAGSLGIILLIGMGHFGAGGSNAIMGKISDHYLPDALNKAKTISILESIENRFPRYVEKADALAGNPKELVQLGYRKSEVKNILNYADEALEYYRKNNKLNGNLTGNALRSLINAKLKQELKLTAEASSVLRPADNYGGRMSFLWISPFAFLLSIVFLIIFIKDKKKGGYQIEQLK